MEQRSPSTLARLQRTPFIGREAELGALKERLDAARQGEGGAVLISGEPGIGKTRLLGELAERARSDGWTVLDGRAYQADWMPPYLPLVDALRGYVRTASPDDLRAQLGEGAADVVLLVRELRGRIPDLPAPAAISTDLERYRFFESVTDFLLAIARGPLGYGVASVDDASARRSRNAKRGTDPPGLLLILDDLHWADASSVRLLLHLVQRLRGEPVLVAGAYRDLEVGQAHPLMELLAGVVREPAGTRVPLAGLTEADVARFVELTAGGEPAPALVATVFTKTEGNPLYMVELVRLMLEAGELAGGDAKRLIVPPGVQHVIGRRLDRLSAECNEVLTTAAVLGRAFSVPELEVTGDLTGDALLLALEEAEAARVLAPAPESPGRFIFAHPLIREMLYNQILTSRRVRLHRRTGEALEAFYRANPEPHLSELAFHFLQAAPGGDAERAIAYAHRAGDRSRSLFAYEEAARQYQTALHLDTAHAPAGTGRRVELLLALAEAEARAGEGATARDHFRVAADAARLLAAQGDMEHAAPLLARAALGFAEERGIPGVIDAVRIGLLEEALTMLGDGDGDARALVLARLAVELSDADGRERRAALSAEAVAVARRAGAPATLAAALNGRHYTLYQPDKLPERLAVIAEIVRLADAAGDREVALQGHYLRLLDMLEVGDEPAATAELEIHARIAAEVRQPFYLWRTTFLRATFALLTGEFAAAGGLAAEALAYTRRAQIANAQQAFGVQTFVLRWHTGTLRDVEGAVAGFAAQYSAVPAWQAALALLYSDLGREPDARAVFERLAAFTASGRPPAEDFAGLPQDEAWTTAVALLADVCAELGDARRAEALYRLLLPYEQRLIAVVGGAACLGAAARYLGLLAATCGRWSAAERHFEDALAISARMYARPWLAYTERDFAAMLLRRDRSGDGHRARALLDSALATGAELGMPRLVAQCQALLGTGAAMRPVAPAPAAGRTAPNGLSAREIEVLGLLAEGNTNREIANALVLSSRTVDHHIAAIYRKLNVSRRAEAAAYALRHGLT